MKKIKSVFLIIGILITLFIFSQSLLNSDASSELSSGITNQTYLFLTRLNIIVDFNNLHNIIRKLAHFSEFFLLGLSFGIFYKLESKIKYPFLYTIIQGILTAIIDESIQTFIPGRSGEILDVLIDSLGVIIAVIIIYTTNKIYKNRKDFK